MVLTRERRPLGDISNQSAMRKNGNKMDVFVPQKKNAPRPLQTIVPLSNTRYNCDTPVATRPVVVPVVHDAAPVEPTVVHDCGGQCERNARRRLSNICEDDDDFVYPGHPAWDPISIKVKNTFVDFSPRTPERSERQKSPKISMSCPGKFSLGAEERAEWEKTQELTIVAANLFAGSEEPKPQMKNEDPTMSVGSLLHSAELCKPCAWFHHAKGCQRGGRCEFCHMCPPGEIKKRKKEKALLIRKREKNARHGMDGGESPERPIMVSRTPTSSFTAESARAKPFTPSARAMPFTPQAQQRTPASNYTPSSQQYTPSAQYTPSPVVPSQFNYSVQSEQQQNYTPQTPYSMPPTPQSSMPQTPQTQQSYLQTPQSRMNRDSAQHQSYFEYGYGSVDPQSQW